MNKNERLDDHQKFKELAALAQRGTLSENERLELNRHLEVCGSCRQAYEEYRLISTEGMNFLAAAYDLGQECRAWDNRPVRDKLLARIRTEEVKPTPQLLRISKTHLRRNLRALWAPVAACVLVAVAVGAYEVGSRAAMVQRPLGSTSIRETQSLAQENEEKQASDELIASQNAQLTRLQAQVASDQQEIARLRDASRAAEARSASLSSATAETNERFQQAQQQRDILASQLRDAEQSYQVMQAELTNLRTEHDRTLLHTTSLESKIDELTASARDQEHRLKDDEQYLDSDRDIRELMGARKLYIADVFDVDSGSRTRKPFGRVFYTESKSLIFYAFDLDRQPGVKNASAFQVWGQKDAEAGEKNRAMNLGILYMDSESNRRWVLRFDDPKQLAEIDAVFVTVEPQGGSQKPTGKPFLYALLRRAANHP
jgi:hypothetical protein